MTVEEKLEKLTKREIVIPAKEDLKNFVDGWAEITKNNQHKDLAKKALVELIKEYQLRKEHWTTCEEQVRPYEDAIYVLALSLGIKIDKTFAQAEEEAHDGIPYFLIRENKTYIEDIDKLLEEDKKKIKQDYERRGFSLFVPI